LTDDRVVRLTAPPSWAKNTPDIKAIDALRTAGSRPARRDPIDARIIGSINRGDGRNIDSQEGVCGYPVRPATTRALVVPENIEERKRWLDAMADALAEDKTMDVKAFTRRHSER
jgi:hypothetical protein